MLPLYTFRKKIMFFIASFFPIWAIVLGKYLIENHTTFDVIISFIIIIGIIITTISALREFSNHYNTISGEKGKIVKVKEKSDKVVAHIVAYFFFILIDIHDYSDLFIILSMIILISIIFTRSGLVLTNPSLLILGFKIYAISTISPVQDIDSTKELRSVTILTKESLYRDDIVTMVELSQGIYLNKD
ncbi:MAG: hypothetical protein ACW9W4_01245 [Candidatus Nitrosopumilus sp. bin_7KS]